jgi:hypothetical protein
MFNPLHSHHSCHPFQSVYFRQILDIPKNVMSDRLEIGPSLPPQAPNLWESVFWQWHLFKPHGAPVGNGRLERWR